MNTHQLCRRFVLLLSLTLVLCVGVSGTTAYLMDKSNVLANTFIYDPSIFPPVVGPVPEIDLPNTGDDSSLLLSGAALAMSIGALVMIKNRKREA